MKYIPHLLQVQPILPNGHMTSRRVDVILTSYACWDARLVIGSRAALKDTQHHRPARPFEDHHVLVSKKI